MVFFNVIWEDTNPFRNVFLFWIIVTILANHSNRLYQTKREVYESIEVGQVIKSVAISSLCAIVVIYLGKIEDFPRTVFILTTILMVLTFSLSLVKSIRMIS